MKFFIPIFLFSLSVFSQTDEQRKEIQSKYSVEKHIQLKNKHQHFLEKQNEELKHFRFKGSIPNRIIDGIPVYYHNNNNGPTGSSTTIYATSLYPGGTLGLSVTGSGMTAGVWDGGKIKTTHQELNGRVTQVDAPSAFSDHSTHVTGTIAASGVNDNARGIAFESKVRAYDWNSDTSEMIDFGFNGYLASNHSYGYTISALPVWLFGAYDDTTVEFDDLANNYPFYLTCVAAGNDRTSTGNTHVKGKGGYDLLTGSATAKNNLVVAAVDGIASYDDNTSVVMSSFSNYGPTDDGRIKPDISAKGVEVFSCISTSNTAYATLQGTSMATPAITGLVVLLQNHYSNVNGGDFMPSSLVKGLICHSAFEAGANPGPDYEFGWGLANAEKAADIITNNKKTSVLEFNNLADGQVFTKEITVTSSQKLEFTICWTDPTGVKTVTNKVDDRTPNLVNNLDLLIVKGNNEFYPWKLDPDNPTNAAVQDVNDVDNIEKVQIDGAEPGVYTIKVSHKGTLTNGAQDFALIASADVAILGNNDFDIKSNVRISPNPTSSILYFALDNDVVLDDIKVIDSLGKVVKSTSTLIDNKLDVSDLSSGIYFLKSHANGKPVVNKFIKE